MILGSAIIGRVKVSWTGHARKKLMVLRGHGVDVTEQRVEEVLATPARIVSGHGGRRIAEGDLDSLHVMRVVYADRHHVPGTEGAICERSRTTLMATRS